MVVADPWMSFSETPWMSSPLPGHPSLPAHFGGALGRGLQFCGGKRGAGPSKHGAGPENVEAQEKIGDFMWM